MLGLILLTSPLSPLPLSTLASKIGSAPISPRHPHLSGSSSGSCCLDHHGPSPSSASAPALFFLPPLELGYYLLGPLAGLLLGYLFLLGHGPSHLVYNLLHGDVGLGEPAFLIAEPAVVRVYGP